MPVDLHFDDQIAVKYLFCPEAKIAPLHRMALKAAGDKSTVVTNVLTGRPARGFVNRVIRELGPISDVAPAFPLAFGALAPLHIKAQAEGSGDFSPMWAGQAVALGREMPAYELTKVLAQETQDLLGKMANSGPSGR
jgi:nitronate monooxygenase